MSDASSTIAHLTCAELVEIVTDYLEGALSEDDRLRFELHLVMCEGCVAYLAQFRHTISAVGRLAEDDLSAQARDALLAAFRDWKQRPP